MRKKRPPAKRSGLHVVIAGILESRELTAVDIAAALEKDEFAVGSALRGMERRGEVERVPYRAGQWAKWRLPKRDSICSATR